VFLQKIDEAVAGFATPPLHHVHISPPALMSSKFVFVHEDASSPSLSPLYRGPYWVLEHRDKYFRLQIGSKTDSVSIDRLKPVFSDEPIEPALPPVRGGGPEPVPPLPSVPPLLPDIWPPPAPPAEKKKKMKRVRFNLSVSKPPPVPVRCNPPRQVRRFPPALAQPPHTHL